MSPASSLSPFFFILTPKKPISPSSSTEPHPDLHRHPFVAVPSSASHPISPSPTNRQAPVHAPASETPPQSRATTSTSPQLLLEHRLRSSPPRRTRARHLEPDPAPPPPCPTPPPGRRLCSRSPLRRPPPLSHLRPPPDPNSSSPPTAAPPRAHPLQPSSLSPSDELRPRQRQRRPVAPRRPLWLSPEPSSNELQQSHLLLHLLRPSPPASPRIAALSPTLSSSTSLSPTRSPRQPLTSNHRRPAQI